MGVPCVGVAPLPGLSNSISHPHPHGGFACGDDDDDDDGDMLVSFLEAISLIAKCIHTSCLRRDFDVLRQELVCVTTAVLIFGEFHLRVRFYPRLKSGVCISGLRCLYYSVALSRIYRWWVNDPLNRRSTSQ